MKQQTTSDWMTRVAPVKRPVADARCIYDRRARSYDLIEAPFERHARAAGLQLLDVKPGERVLEIGCGTGHTLTTLARAVGDTGQVIGIDLSAGMLAVTRRRLRHHRDAQRPQLLQADCRAIPLVNGTVDAVTMRFTLDLIATEEIPAVLAECRRVLRHAGRICVVGLDLPARAPRMTRLYLAAHRRWPRLVDCRPLPLPEVLADCGYAPTNNWTSTIIGIPVTAITAAPGATTPPSDSPP